MMKISKEKIHEVDLSQIDEPKGIVRLEIDQEEIAELAKSISALGQLQPIVIRRDGERYEIIFGHRRYLAFELLDRSTIKAVIRDMDDRLAALTRATENLARVNLTPIEEGAIYKNLIEIHGLTIDQVVERMGRTFGVVKKRLDLMKMPEQLQKAVHTGQIVVGVAEELWRIDDEGHRNYLLEVAIENGVTRKVVREWVTDWIQRQKKQETLGDWGRGESPVYLERTVYVACDLCDGSMKLGSEQLIRCCPGCGELIKNALKGGAA